MKWATPADVVTRWTGSEAPDEDDATIGVLVEDAEEIILGKYPNIDTRIKNGSLGVRTVIIVIAGMVQRAYQSRQDGLTSYSNGVGSFSESGAYGDMRRGLYLTRDEISYLAPNLTAGKAFSVDMLPKNYRRFGIGETGMYHGYFYRENGYTGEG